MQVEGQSGDCILASSAFCRISFSLQHWATEVSRGLGAGGQRGPGTEVICGAEVGCRSWEIFFTVPCWDFIMPNADLFQPRDDLFWFEIDLFKPTDEPTTKPRGDPIRPIDDRFRRIVGPLKLRGVRCALAGCRENARRRVKPLQSIL